MKREVARFDFKAFGQAIKAARKAKGISRNQLADKMNIAPRYIASIENMALRIASMLSRLIRDSPARVKSQSSGRESICESKPFAFKDKFRSRKW